MLDASGLLNGRAHFLHWGVVQLSLTNLIVIVLMILVFAVAVLVRLPGHDSGKSGRGGSDDQR